MTKGAWSVPKSCFIFYFSKEYMWTSSKNYCILHLPYLLGNKQQQRPQRLHWQPNFRTHHWDTEAKLCHCCAWRTSISPWSNIIPDPLCTCSAQGGWIADSLILWQLRMVWIIWILRKTIVLIKWPLDQSWTYICDLGAANCSLAYKSANKVNNKLGGTVVGIT